jgi:hypothetical protein
MASLRFMMKAHSMRILAVRPEDNWAQVNYNGQGARSIHGTSSKGRNETLATICRRRFWISF